jgi:hypothetical protein
MRRKDQARVVLWRVVAQRPLVVTREIKRFIFRFWFYQVDRQKAGKPIY